MDYGASKIYR